MRGRVPIGMIVAVAAGLVLTTGTGSQWVEFGGTAASAQAATGPKTSARAIRWYQNDMRAFAEARRRKLGVMLFLDPRAVDPNKLDSAALRKAELGRIRRLVTAKQLLAMLPARPGSRKRKRP